MKSLLAGLVLLVSTTAFADQCAYISKTQAQRALKIALEAKSIATLCEPCGETAAKVLETKSIGIHDVNYNGYWELQVNGKGMDLAYTFVNGLNLSKLAGCESQGVSSSIRRD